MNSFSFIIPTLGRETIRKALRAVIEESQEGDEILIIADGEDAYERIDKIYPVDCRPSWFQVWETDRTEERGGAPQRDLGVELAMGTWLLFIDDDDKYFPGGVTKIREVVSSGPLVPHMFRIDHARDSIWKDKEVRNGNVSTQMFVTPNIRGLLGRWETDDPEPNRGSDLKFIESTLALWPEGSLVWREEKIGRLFRHSRWREPT